MKKIRLIRDKSPSNDWTEVDKKEAYEWLKGELHLSIQELTDSGYKDLYKFADVLEILYALAKKAKFTPKDLEIARKVKLKERGGFSNKILLKR